MSCDAASANFDIAECGEANWEHQPPRGQCREMGPWGVVEAVCVAVVITPVNAPPSETGFAPTGEETTGLGALGAAHG